MHDHILNLKQHYAAYTPTDLPTTWLPSIFKSKSRQREEQEDEELNKIPIPPFLPTRQEVVFRKRPYFFQALKKQSDLYAKEQKDQATKYSLRWREVCICRFLDTRLRSLSKQRSWRMLLLCSARKTSLKSVSLVGYWEKRVWGESAKRSGRIEGIQRVQRGVRRETECLV